MSLEEISLIKFSALSKLTPNLLSSFAVWIYAWVCASTPGLTLIKTSTVFPPNCFDEDVYNEEKFMEICPTSDDLWFYIMALKNGYKIKATKADFYRLNSVPNSQETALCKINDKNQYEIFFSHLYNIVKEYNP